MNAIFTLSLWDNITSEEREAEANQISDLLPVGFIYQGLQRHNLGDKSHEIAYFIFEDARFALLPGFIGMLGYDRNGSSPVSPEQITEWKASWESYYGGSSDLTLPDELDRVLMPFRSVSLAPFLIEVEAVERQELFDVIDEDEEFEDTQIVPALLRKEGFRAPTVDEWEYACSGSTTTLFRWGNETPTLSSYDEKVWNLHRLPNAFGLIMNFDTYKAEICDEGVVRGGDGGSAVCGGHGIFDTWLPLANAFTCPEQETDPFLYLMESSVWRRVYPLEVLLKAHH